MIPDEQRAAEEPIPRRRSPIVVSPETLVRTGRLDPSLPLPWLVEPAVSGIDLTAWVSANAAWLLHQLQSTGAILFRGFRVDDVDGFRAIANAFGSPLIEYNYGSTPRTGVGGNVYTSTEYPSEHEIPLHNELSYSMLWPMRLWLCCLTPAVQGGQTPLCDSRAVYRRIDPEIREEFERRRVMYVRNYYDGIDVPWQSVFGSDDRVAVEEFCRNTNISFEWVDGQRLRTRQVCQAAADHPVTGDRVWFNQAHLFHHSSRGAETMAALLAEFDEPDLPRTALFGDGTPIPPAMLDDIRAAYRSEEIVFPWLRSDVVMLDNMLVAHGRKAYTGDRRVVVAMAEPSGAGQLI